MTTNQRAQQLWDLIQDKKLLCHPFYKAWMEGSLKLKDLQDYAIAYNPFVEAFPSFVSSAHSLAGTQEARKILLFQLMEEEGVGFECDHPELWLRFGEGLELNRNTVSGSEACEAARKLCNLFREKTKASFPEALGTLLAYEFQNVEVSKTKIEGLVKNFGITQKRSLEFFKVHAVADEGHSDQCLKLLNDLNSQDQEKALKAFQEAAQGLWDFLSCFKIPQA